MKKLKTAFISLLCLSCMTISNKGSASYAERRQRSPIRIIMSGAGGATVVDSAVRLLPFTFQL